MFTDREHEILDEHFREWFADYGQPGFAADNDTVRENLAERIRETDDEPELQGELLTILTKYNS